MSVQYSKPEDASLIHWSHVPDALKSSGILIGNGVSRTISEGFKYDSLFESAKDATNATHLLKSDIDLFAAFDTTNFELVLQSLATARRVLDALGKSDPAIEDQYDRIRDALVAAVYVKHIKRSDIPDDTLQAISDELSRYEWVYSTNYDLIVYWALMQVDAKGFKDFFRKPCFDIENTDVWGKCTKVLFLHGALHLYRDIDGDSCKLINDGSSILDQFAQQHTVPLFVAEGKSEDKLASIARSDYLAFAYLKLTQHDDPLVILGQGLGDSDRHLVRAIKSGRMNRLAVGIYPVDPPTIIEEKARYKALFPRCEIVFFDQTTHPLGDPALKVEP